MVLQVLADPGEVVVNRNTKRHQLRARADTREQQQL
jgi:hypothetical protein